MTMTAPAVDCQLMTNDSTPDQHASGVTNSRERWTVTRYAALVVIRVEDPTDDVQWPDEPTACREFADRVATLTRRSAG
jgi:hypothetical protein